MASDQNNKLVRIWARIPEEDWRAIICNSATNVYSVS